MRLDDTAKRLRALSESRFHALWCHTIIRAKDTDSMLNVCVQKGLAMKRPTTSPSKADFVLTRSGLAVGNLTFTGKL